MSWSIILIKTPLNDESDLSDVDETLPITDRNAFVDWMQNTFIISDDNLSDSEMILQLDNECGVEISWDDNESIENIHLCFHGGENEETIKKYAYLSSSIVKEMAMYGGDISKFVPESIVDIVRERYSSSYNIKANEKGDIK